MHIPTATFRACGSLQVAAVVARDFVRVMSDLEITFMVRWFLNREEAMQFRLALQQVPNKQRRFRGKRFRADEKLMVALAQKAKEPETLQAMADSMYCKAICRDLKKAGCGKRAAKILALRREPQDMCWQLRELPPEDRRYGLPLCEGSYGVTERIGR